MTAPVRSIDLSYGSSLVTPNWCGKQITKGIVMAVADLWAGQDRFPDAARALRYWREAGGQIGGYFCVSNSRPAAEHFAIAKETAGAEWPLLSVVAVDVELATTTAIVREAYRLVEEDNLLAMVYTSAGEWQLRTGDSHDCADLRLWDASQGLAPSLEMSLAYGGWTKRAAHQYQGTTLLDGIEVDFSIFDGDVLAERPAVPAVVPDMDRINAALDRLWADSIAVGGFGAQDRAVAMQRAIIVLKEELGLQARQQA